MSSIKCTQCGMANGFTSSACKSCGATLAGSVSASFTLPSFYETSYPRAYLPQEAKHGETIKPCLHCGKDLAPKKWDSWNGFLVQCPHCGGLHGKHWNIGRVLFASFLFSALSFFLQYDPRKLCLP